MSREKQDEWKRTQLRIPHDQYEAVMVYAEKNNLSLNSAILDLIDKGLDYEDKFNPSNLEENGDIGSEILEHLKSIERLIGEKEFFESIGNFNNKLK